MRRSITPDDARDILYSLPVAPKTETVRIDDALNRVVAEDIQAKNAVPPFDRSPWDGYALRGADTVNASRSNPAILKITEELPAGKAPTMELKPGFAAKILTGAPLPLGADCTVKYEVTEFTDSEVKIFEPIKSGTDVAYAGDDIPLGAFVVKRGDVITPPRMGMIASVGVAELCVYKPPRAAIINTGTELVEPGNPLPPAKIYNSNVFTLSGYLRSRGVDAFNFGVVHDDPDAIAERIKSALEVSDIVITTGGASVGDYDFAVTATERIGAKCLFWKTAIKPGGSVVASVLDGKLILGLPGNPGGAIMFLLRCAMPYIMKLCGRSDPFPEPVDVILRTPFDKLSERSRLLRGRLEIADCKAYFAEYGAQGGGDISSFAGADLIAEIPANSEALPIGTTVKAWRL